METLWSYLVHVVEPDWSAVNDMLYVSELSKSLSKTWPGSIPIFGLKLFHSDLSSATNCISALIVSRVNVVVGAAVTILQYPMQKKMYIISDLNGDWWGGHIFAWKNHLDFICNGWDQFLNYQD